jgi:hypothetical protein
MSTSMSESQQFLLEDSSSSDDSDIDELILDDDVEQAMVIDEVLPRQCPCLRAFET